MEMNGIVKEVEMNEKRKKDEKHVTWTIKIKPDEDSNNEINLPRDVILKSEYPLDFKEGEKVSVKIEVIE